MSDDVIRFDDGASYERGMGVWSQLAGHVFLDWLAPSPGQRWVDIGCGNGAFTELLMRRCTPASVEALDPSEGQLSYARTRDGTAGVSFRVGDAMALPFDDRSFDAAVMALVIFFVPDPAKGVAEMVRVVRRGGLVAAYAWDILEGGFPFRLIGSALQKAGKNPPLPPSAPVSKMEALRATWEAAGLEAIETRAITVERSFADFEDYWTASTAITAKTMLAAMAPDEVMRVKQEVRAQLTPDPSGRIVFDARANAIKGRVRG